ncbi:MAG: methyl-accepting chemotaxis protein [Patescibacteria group bacterium]|nr:methyl-accepting chemotaxis protein [Patescibacteria group bacterium]
MSFVSNLSTKWKLISGFLAVATITAIVGGIGFWGAYRLAGNVHEIGEVRLPSIDTLRTIKGRAENIRGCLRTLGMPGLTAEERQRQVNLMASAREVYEAAWAKYEPLPQTPEEAKLWKQFVPAWQAWRDENNKALELFSQFDGLGLPDPLDTARRLEGFIKDHYVISENVLRMIQTKKSFEGGEDHTTCNYGRWLTTFTTDSDVLKKTIQAMEAPHRRFHEAVRQIKQLVADGNTDQAMTVYEREMSPAAEETFRSFAELLAAAENAASVRAQATARLLGPAADRQREANELLDQIIAINEHTATEEVANGQSMATLAETMALGGTVFGVVLAVVFGLFLASSISKVLAALIQETKRLGEAAVAGKLETRGNPELVSAEFRPIIEGVNATLDAVIGPLNVAAEYVDRISKGDIPEPITETYRGDFNEIKNNLNQCIAAVARMVTDANALSEAAVQGQLAKRADVTKHQGDFRRIVQGVNDTLDAVIGPLNVAAEYVDRLSKGDMPEKITDNYRGDFNEIKNNLNQCIESITALLDAGQAVRRVAEGDLDARGDESRVLGSYRQMIATVNATMEAFIVPVREIGQTLKKMARKDFSECVEKNYPGIFGELRDDVNGVVRNMQDALTQINESASQFAEGARVIAESAQSLAQGAQTQSSSVEEMNASIEELAHSVEGVKENATAANRLATDTNTLAEHGGVAVQKSSESMALIRTSSNQIGEIIQVISEIASQTNLLALNAAIEAARAGEHGMGFAVVADEVRKLAERSNQAAQEVSTLIKESTSRVEEGTRLSDDTAKALDQIVEGVQATATRIAEIAAATVQQAGNANEVAQAVQGVAQVTEQSAAGSEEMASSSQQLGAQATSLRELVATFKLA